jgi:hypothetical protein
MWQDNRIVFMAAQILLPLIPAVLLFWLLPGDAQVVSNHDTNPVLGHLRIKLGGAFAGYVVLFSLLVHYNPAPAASRQENWQAWHVDGRIALDERDVPTGPPLGTAQILQSPANFSINDTGGFNVDVLVKPGPGETMEFPTVVATLDGYSPVSVDLTGKAPKIGPNFGVDLDPNAREIHISEPIVLHAARPKHATITAQRIQ